MVRATFMCEIVPSKKCRQHFRWTPESCGIGFATLDEMLQNLQNFFRMANPNSWTVHFGKICLVFSALAINAQDFTTENA
uniref:Uncharacterized protein n=1 Tax=Parascaris univalens TaxID=6257 RepID=A0A915C397_PARUN